MILRVNGVASGSEVDAIAEELCHLRRKCIFDLHIMLFIV
jgi:hypothetical protein